MRVPRISDFALSLAYALFYAFFSDGGNVKQGMSFTLRVLQSLVQLFFLLWRYATVKDCFFAVFVGLLKELDAAKNVGQVFKIFSSRYQ